MLFSLIFLTWTTLLTSINAMHTGHQSQDPLVFDPESDLQEVEVYPVDSEPISDDFEIEIELDFELEPESESEPESTPEQCLTYSGDFLSPLDPLSLLPHATASLHNYCPDTSSSLPVALHPVPVDGYGWVYDFSANCDCSGTSRFWIYFPLLSSPSTKMPCHDANGVQIDEEMVQVDEPYVLHGSNCESNTGAEDGINGGLGTCDHGIKRTWKMGVGEEWKTLKAEKDLVWVIEGWGDCEVEGKQKF